VSSSKSGRRVWLGGISLSRLGLVAPLFFLSGASSLVFETLWTRALVRVFGATHFAVTTVLATYMGGLALGSFLAGRMADRMARPEYLLRTYGLVEGGVGLYALALPLILALVERFNVAMWLWIHPSFYTFSLLRFLLVGVLLLVPTTLMGASLPLLGRYVTRSHWELGRQAGTLYAVNTFGALLGAFVAGFLLLPMLGTSWTNWLACGTNLLILAVAVTLARRTAGDSKTDASAPAEVAVSGRLSFQARIAVIGIGVSGAVAMVYQVAWNRILSLVLGSSVYAFTLILLCFLLGLAAGGALYARRNADQPRQMANLSVTHILIAVTVILGMMVMDRLPAAFVMLIKVLTLTTLSAFVVKFVLAAVVVLLPTFFMGMIFPATIRLASEAEAKTGWTVGYVYGINTVGAIVGSVVGGFILVPYLGLQVTVAVMALSNLLLAAVFGSVGRGTRFMRWSRIGAALLVAVGLVAFYRPWNLSSMVSGVFRVSVYDMAHMKLAKSSVRIPDFVEWPEWKQARARATHHLAGLAGHDTWLEPIVDHRLVFYREGLVTTVSVERIIMEGLAGQYCWEHLALQVNGKTDASASGRFARPKGRDCRELAMHPAAFGPMVAISRFGDMQTEMESGLLGAVLLPPGRPPDRALVVGWGSGLTVGSLLTTGVRRVDAVELEREVITGARWFLRYNHWATQDPRVHLVEGDGRTFLAAAGKPYDLIVSEPSNPWITGCSNLFTVEYFRLVARHLANSGTFVQWLQIYEISPQNVRVILATLAAVFPYVYVFRSAPSVTDLLLVASKRPLALDYRWLEKWLAVGPVAKEFGRIQIHGPADLAVRFIMGGEDVRRFVAGVGLNTDDNARVEFSAPKDLINYYRFDPKRIARHMEQAARPLRSLVRNAPSGFELELARAWIKAGRLDRARACLADAPPNRVGPMLATLSAMKGGPDACGRLLGSLGEFGARKWKGASGRRSWERVVDRVLRGDWVGRSESVTDLLLSCALSKMEWDTDALIFGWAGKNLADDALRPTACQVVYGILMHNGIFGLGAHVFDDCRARRTAGR